MTGQSLREDEPHWRALESVQKDLIVESAIIDGSPPAAAEQVPRSPVVVLNAYAFVSQVIFVINHAHCALSNRLRLQ